MGAKENSRRVHNGTAFSLTVPVPVSGFAFGSGSGSGRALTKTGLSSWARFRHQSSEATIGHLSPRGTLKGALFNEQSFPASFYTSDSASRLCHSTRLEPSRA